MTNVERQKSLDKQKWIMSEECGEDLSGEMLYCGFCGGQTPDKKCSISQENREKVCECARAYNRMKRYKL